MSPDRENSIFLTYRGDIFERLDPSPYQLLRTSSINAIKSSKYQWVNLKDAVEFRKEIVSDSSELPYVGLENIKSNTGFYVPSTEEKEAFNSALKFEVGDVLFPKLRPYLNKVHLARFKGVCTTEFHVLKGINLNNLYLSTFLSSKLVLNQTTCLMTGNTLPRLQTQDVKRLPILLPPPEIQNDIAEIMQSAYNQKEQKDQEADALLDSIDDYVLTELGIEVPTVEEKKRFVVYASETAGNRLDPHYHHPLFEKLLSVLRRNPHKTLGSIIKLCHHKWDPEKHQEDRFRYIEINGVSRVTGEVSFSEVLVKEAPSRAQMMVQKDDIIVSLTRPHHGSIALINDDLDSCVASTGFAILREIKHPTLNRTYLYSVLRSQLCLSQMLQRSSGGNYPAITTDQLMRILIPIPLPEIQEQIAEKSLRLRSEATKLRQEADSVVEAAKEKVEQILLAGT